ncbi:MAG: MotA/TolQ/ExbB proton channel family protein [Verrucomicrobiota bacterium]
MERFFFIIRERVRFKPQAVDEILKRVEHHDLDGAIKAGQGSGDFIVRVLTFALAHRAESFSNAVLRAANLELKKFNRGLAVLDTIVTLAPLLGLLGTVTGMIHAFGLLGAQHLDAPEAITGGIAQALIATAFGLGIAITALVPFNYLNARLEEARHDIEDAATQLELHLEQCKECKQEGESK